MRSVVEPLQLAMERGAADAERLGCRRYVALGAQQRASQDAALDVAEMLDRIGSAEQVRRRNRTERAFRCETQGYARRACCADDEVVGIDCKQSATRTVSC